MGQSVDTSIKGYVPISHITDEIRINEILFNPFEKGVDFVELYNCSPSFIDAAHICLAKKDTENPIKYLSRVCLPSKIIPPKGFMVLCADSGILSNQYILKEPSSVSTLKQMPNFPDNQGYVVLENIDSTVIDHVLYHRDWHFDLIEDQNGVSLERVSCFQASQNPSNWHSASQAVGYATPTYQNSQFLNNENSHTSSSLQLFPPVFTPNLDGIDDWLSIFFQSKTNVGSINCSIWDMQGRFIRQVAENYFISSEASFKWDGIDHKGRLAQIGNYIVLLEFISQQGNVQKFKKTCTLGAKL